MGAHKGKKVRNQSVKQRELTVRLPLDLYNEFDKLRVTAGVSTDKMIESAVTALLLAAKRATAKVEDEEAAPLLVSPSGAEVASVQATRNPIL